MLRTLAHHWRVNLAVVVGAAVASAVLGGALLVGDSVRGSLRGLTLERLGRIDSALVTERFMRQDLAEELSATPAIVLQGAATHPDSGRRASRVGIHGIDSRFAELFEDAAGFDLERGTGQVFPSAVVNESLARELDVATGDGLLLSFGRRSHIPRETLMGDRDPDAVLGTLRVEIVSVVPDRGPGRFGLIPRQQNPRNVFVELRQAQRALGRRGEVNAVFVSNRGDASAGPAEALQQVLRLEDLGLTIERGEDHLVVGSREFVLRPDVDRAIEEAAREIGAPLMRTQTYLANGMRSGDRLLPYSIVAALDPIPGAAWASLTQVDGTPAPDPGDDGILLNAWAAEDLDAKTGDTIVVEYYEVGEREELRETETTFRVAGVVSMKGLGADRTLTPDYPGIQEAQDIAAWDPPFPVDLGRIRAKDEAYWDEHAAAPKAFVSEETGRRLWNTRFGSTTAIRIGARGDDPAGVEERLREALLRRMSPETFGFRFRPVKEEGLRAASGATDFSGLFIAFSFFLILSAAMLVGLLFRLGVERRSGEVGLLLAVGHRVARVRRGLLAEGGLLAALGGILGLAGGIAYAALMMVGLRTLWLPAVGSSRLDLHVAPTTLPIGWVVSVVVVLLSVFLAVRKLVRVAPQRLLAGALGARSTRRAGRINAALAFGGLAGAAVLIAAAVVTGSLESPGLAFGTGALLLISGLAFFTRWCRGSRRRSLAPGGGVLSGMAARNSSWNPGRSILSVALVASACFVIVVVGANRGEAEIDLEDRRSGSGGFSLIAEADVPLHQDLNSGSARFDLGFADADSERLDGVEFFQFRVVPGDDASCLNLYQPEKPTLLGVPSSFVERGGFEFQSSLELPEGSDEAWSLLEAELEPGVVPAIADYNSAMWILHKALGDEIELENELGQPLRVRLVGLLKGSIFQSELLISEERFLEQFPGRTGDGYFLVDAPAERAEELSGILEGALSEFGFDVTTTRRKIADYKVVENTYMSTFQMLGGLGLLLGTIGLAVVLVRNVIERRGELATLRAFGFRRSRLALLVVAENAFLLVTGMTIGTLAALAAAGPRLASAGVPWASLSGTLAVVLVVGLLSSVAAVLGTLKIPLLPSLKAE